MESGEQFVMISLIEMMLMLLVVNWDFRDLYASAMLEVLSKILCGPSTVNLQPMIALIHLTYRFQPGQSQQPTFLDDLRCTGRETSLITCPHPGIGNHDCRHFEDVGLLCTSATTPPTPGKSSFEQLATTSSTSNI